MVDVQLVSAELRGNHRIRPTLRGDLRRAIPDAAAALALSGLVFAILVNRIHAGVDPALQEMPTMMRSGGIWPYTWSQAVGWAALSWSWLTILLGVSLPVLGRQGRPRMREAIERLHRSTSLTVVALMIIHAVLLIWDKMGDTMVTVFVPWTTSYAPGLFPQALGIVSFYFAVLLGLSFYLRERIGWRAWQLLHRYFIPLVYILAFSHTFLYGSDVRTHNGLWVALWLLQLPIAGAFALRLVSAAR
jgi:methionine sulfoxide reductase heme-binding subunit